MKQMDLSGGGKPAPDLVQYQVGGVMWRCNQFAALQAELEQLAPADLPLLHELLRPKERPWLIVRRLFGLQPVVPPHDASLDDLRAWGREELRAALGLTKAQLKQELEVVRGAWSAVKPAPLQEAIRPPAKEYKETLTFADDDTLVKHGFRIQFEDRELRTRFAQRVRDFEKLLLEKMTSGLARMALMTELQLWQIDEYLADPNRGKVGTADWRTNTKTRGELASTYEDTLGEINKIAPWASGITGKYTFVGVLSDITRAIQEYKAKEDKRLIDGMFTALEVLVECRRSAQMPNPRYRAGLVVYVAAAREGLWNPNWQNPFTTAQTKRLDQAWQAAYNAAVDAVGEPLPDLEKDGAEGEYAPLAVAAPPEVNHG